MEHIKRYKFFPLTTTTDIDMLFFFLIYLYLIWFAYRWFNIYKKKKETNIYSSFGENCNITFYVIHFI